MSFHGEGKATSCQKKINKVSVVDQVCTALKQDIMSDVWKPGDRLPSEAELAAHFGVNRLSVRVALQKLNTLGIVETRVGEGSFVCKFSLRPVLNELSDFYSSEDAFYDVQQFRQMLDYNSVILAIKSATEKEKAELGEALQGYNRCAEKYVEDVDNDDLLYEMVDADFNFHYTVVKMSHNRLFKDVYFMAQELIRENISKLISERCHRRRDAGYPPLKHNDGHDIMYQCIMTSDIELLHGAIDAILGIIPVENLDIFN